MSVARPNPIRIGTRGSQLAVWQAEFIKRRLLSHDPTLSIELLRITTTGDRVHGSLAQHGGKALFLKEIEEALLQGAVDLAVHSLKDVPAELPASLTLVAIAEREDVRDAVIATQPGGLGAIPAGGVIGTASLRRRWQLRRLRPDCRIEEARGNVDTRVRKVAEGKSPAILLAMAGLRRLGLIPTGDAAVHVTPLAVEEMLPAIGQGAIVVEGRATDTALGALVRAACHHAPTAIAVAAERAVMRAVGGDCFTPLAAYAAIDGTTLHLRTWLATTDGTRSASVCRAFTIRDGAVDMVAGFGEVLGRELMEQLAYTNT